MQTITLRVIETIEYTVTREVEDGWDVDDADVHALLLDGSDLSGPVLSAAVLDRDIDAVEVI